MTTSGEYLASRGFKRDPCADRWVSPIDGVEVLGVECAKYDWLYISHLVDVRRDIEAERRRQSDRAGAKLYARGWGKGQKSGLVQSLVRRLLRL